MILSIYFDLGIIPLNIQNKVDFDLKKKPFLGHSENDIRIKF